MSHLPGNPYLERLVNDKQPRTSESLATLALAYERRTANLIALGQLVVSVDGPSADISKDLYQIDTRLGLNKGATP